MKTGITGWAQINGRAELTASVEEKLKYDLYYIQNWSLLFDIKILLRTVFDVLTIRNTY
jgi:lipopolysaccharide/colanic/teichoic acid biosynthesis glycosyltransferase